MGRKSRNPLKPGDIVGRWKVLAAAPNIGLKTAWRCRCVCGTEKVVQSDPLKARRSRSCGCLRDERSREGAATRFRTHGKSKTPESNAWTALKSRCLSRGNPAYRNYGGRGITVCDRWRDSFENFLADMGPRPSVRHSIDRIDNDGPYSPENCRWVTIAEQNRNRRGCEPIEWNGRAMMLSEWAAEIGISPDALRARLEHGWSLARALSTGLHHAGRQR